MTQETKHLHIILISIHGLIRGHDLELGRDADTGGQTKYVVELARALARQANIAQVDLITRRVVDPAVSADYALEIEVLSENARIIRIAAGPDAYIRKEELWDYLDSFADNCLSWLNSQPQRPDIIHSHYADAGYVGVLLSQWTGLPLIHTGHSLGRDKFRRLLAMGVSMDEFESKYRIMRRINAEEQLLTYASLIITSTHNEIVDQYELYDCYSHEKMMIIPPGTNIDQFYPPLAGQTNIPFIKVLEKFLREPDKPIILALSRPDKRKNIISLLDAYGESKQLQALANLVIVVGNRTDIRDLDHDAQEVITELLIVIDYYNLYGKVAIPKQHTAKDVADIYRLATLSKGIFVNPALTEPFGLTLLEAAASGLPLVATENGGPVDIIKNCNNGLLVEPLDKTDIAQALLKILENTEFWQTLSANGLKNVANFYSWDAHANAYLTKIRDLVSQQKPLTQTPLLVKSRRFRDRALFTAIDETLLGDTESLQQFLQMMREHRKQCLFGVATWRRLDSTLAILKQYNIPVPDILITSLGTEIYFSPELIADIAWTYHIDHLWTPQIVRRLIDEMPGIVPQPKSEQSRYKLSYRFDSENSPSLDEIQTLFRQLELSVNLMQSFGKFFDIIPARASKGHALRYFAGQRQIPMERILVAGCSGADVEMLLGNTLGVVVANHQNEELGMLSDREKIYFSKRSHAGGLLEAIEHYNFFN